MKSSTKSGSGAKTFFIWHSEKIVVGVVVVAALFLAWKGINYQQAITWQASDLVGDATTAEDGIRKNQRTAANEGIDSFPYAEFAQQIRTPISTEPYRNPVSALWNPALHTSSQPVDTRSGY